MMVECKRCLGNGVRLTMDGRRDRLRASLRQTILQAEAMTAGAMSTN